MNWTQSSIILMRHGEPLASNESSDAGMLKTQQIFRGITDDVLSTRGWEQMDNAVREMISLEHIVCSPLLRCSEFAQNLASQSGLPLKQYDALKEINFGQWEGKSVQQIELEFAHGLKRFWQNPLEYTPPDGEPVVDFQRRVIEFWNEFLRANKGKNSLIITHGGVQKIILAKVLDMPVQAVHNIEVPYACCSEIQVYYSKNKVVTTLKSHGTRV